MKYIEPHLKKVMSNNSLIMVFVLLLFFLPLQIYCLITLSPSQTLESNKNITGADNVYYLDGALSILEYEADLKFNNKRQPIFGSKQVDKSSLPKHSSLVATLYPYSSFKFGYSLSVAAVTAIIPVKFFEKTVPRLAFSNLIFTFISLIAVCIILENLSFNIFSKIFSVVIISLDPFLIQTNYVYQSHTVCGLMFLLILLSFFTSKKFDELPLIRAFLMGLSFSMSVLSSSHFTFLLIAVLGLIFLYIFKINCIFSKKIKFSISLILGSTLLPLYILFVENYIDFTNLGLNTFLSQNFEYARVVGSLIDTYSLLNRKIWSYELWNQYLYLSLLFLLIGYIYVYYSFLRYKTYKIDFANFFSSKKYLLLMGIVFSFITGSIYTQPLVRALVPELLILDILIGIALGILVQKSIMTILICGLVTIFFSLNFYDFIKSTKSLGYSFAFWQKGPSKSIAIEDKKIIWDGIIDFHKNAGKNTVASGNLGTYSINLGEFIAQMSVKFKTLPSDIPDDVWIEINPMNIVEQYSHTRRFINQFNPNKKNIVTNEIIEKDFRLFFDIFKYIDSGQLSEKSYYSIPVWHYSPTFFDQEYNYIYGYNGKIKKYLKNTPLENIEFRKIYFINLHDLSLLHTQLNN